MAQLAQRTQAKPQQSVCNPLFASTAEAQKEDAQMHFSDFTYVTRGQLAEELHVTKGTIRQWET